MCSACSISMYNVASMLLNNSDQSVYHQVMVYEKWFSFSCVLTLTKVAASRDERRETDRDKEQERI